VDPGGRHFNLIILDGDLSGPTAPALCTEIRADPTHRKTPIIMLTWNGAGGLAGGNDFLTKPVNPAELAVKAQTWALRHQFGLP
jgi:DNA-binding response OmpR family regulator